MTLLVGYRNRRQVSGDTQNITPNGASRTPQNIVTGAGTTNIYTAGNLTRIKIIDPVEYVGNNLTISAATTGRSIHLYGFDPDATDTILNLRSYIDFRYLVEGSEPTGHRIDSYIWNATNTNWERLDTDSATGNPRTLQGNVAGPDFAEYTDSTGSPHAADVIWILLWDYEGTHNSVAGCMVDGTKVWTPDGARPVGLIKCGDLITGHMDGADVQREVVDTTMHPAAKMRDVIRIETGCGGVGLSPCHYLPTSEGDKQAEFIKAGDRIQSHDGWARVIRAEARREVTAYFDVSPNCRNYYVDDGLLINRTV